MKICIRLKLIFRKLKQIWLSGNFTFENQPYAKARIINHFNKYENPTRKIKETADKSNSTMRHIWKSICLL